jgi:hypothetical protein
MTPIDRRNIPGKAKGGKRTSRIMPGMSNDVVENAYNELGRVWLENGGIRAEKEGA